VYLTIASNPLLTAYRDNCLGSTILTADWISLAVSLGVYFFGLFRTGSEHSICPRSMKWFRTFWTNNMADKLTLLFLSAELEVDDDDDEMNLEESVVTAYCSHSCCFHVI
jgi:hypothetical protein